MLIPLHISKYSIRPYQGWRLRKVKCEQGNLPLLELLCKDAKLHSSSAVSIFEIFLTNNTETELKCLSEM